MTEPTALHRMQDAEATTWEAYSLAITRWVASQERYEDGELEWAEVVKAGKEVDAVRSRYFIANRPVEG